MLIKLTNSADPAEGVLLVNSNNINSVMVDSDETTIVYLREELNSGECQVTVEETLEDIYKQQFKTCKSLLKLTKSAGFAEGVLLINSDNIDSVIVDSYGTTIVCLVEGLAYSDSQEFAVEETPEDIYEQQFKTCESSL